MPAYQTQTEQVSVQQVTQDFLHALDKGHTKEASETGSAFIRDIVRQAAAVRQILPPVGITDSELDRDEFSDQPKKIVEKEPRSVATFVPLNGTPEPLWFSGPRYAVYFGKYLSPRAEKNKFELMTYQNDIRKILADNFVKDMSDQEDKNWRDACMAIINQNPSAQRTYPPAFTSSAFKQAAQRMYARRRPIGKVLMTESLFLESLDLPASQIGSPAASDMFDNGLTSKKKLWNFDVVTTAKTDIYDPREAWMFSPDQFLGNFFVLQDATLFIKQEADMIEFYTYAVLGIGIGNRLSMQHLQFGPSD